MSVILLSIGSYTFASNPAEIFWIDVWVNSTTGQLIGGSTDYQAEVPGAHLSDSPRRVSTELDESRAPFYAIEAFCIAVFTLEYFVRLFASPQGPGVIPFVIGLWNVVDVISILPFYVEIILSFFNLGPQLSYLSVLRLFRLTRITRIFKMSKNLEGLIMLLRSLRKSGPALLMLFALMVSDAAARPAPHALPATRSPSCPPARSPYAYPRRPRFRYQGITGVLFATLIFTMEEGTYDPYRRQYVRVDGSPSPFESIPASFWWTIVTMTCAPAAPALPRLPPHPPPHPPPSPCCTSNV